MSQSELFEPINSTQFDSLSKPEVVCLFQESENIIRKLQEEVEHLRGLLPDRWSRSLFS